MGAVLLRPPLGFVVEGFAEVQCYPTLLSKELHYPVGHLPIVNAKGTGRLTTQLESLLDDLSIRWEPRRAIVAVDARDFRGDEALEDCKALKESLQLRANKWLEAEVTANRSYSLPDQIVVVVQHQCFESFIVADQEGLAATELMRIQAIAVHTDSDNAIVNPAAWLRANAKRGVPTKRPNVLKQLAGAIDVKRASSSSRSLKKLFDEVHIALDPTGGC